MYPNMENMGHKSFFVGKISNTPHNISLSKLLIYIYYT